MEKSKGRGVPGLFTAYSERQVPREREAGVGNLLHNTTGTLLDVSILIATMHGCCDCGKTPPPQSAVCPPDVSITTNSISDRCRVSRWRRRPM